MKFDIDGSDGYDVVSYDNTPNTTNLEFYFNANEVRVEIEVGGVNDPNFVSTVIKGVEEIIGGSGNDTFILDDASNIKIDGGAGDDLVSFRNQTTAFTSGYVFDSNDYANIEGFELTQYDDSISVDLTQKQLFNGFKGRDQVIVKADSTLTYDTLKYVIKDNSDLSTATFYNSSTMVPNTYSARVSNFEIFRGINNINNIFNIEATDNVTNGYTNRQFYIIGGESNGGTFSNIADYTALTTSVNLNIGVNSHTVHTGEQLVNAETHVGSEGYYRFVVDVVKGEHVESNGNRVSISDLLGGMTHIVLAAVSGNVVHVNVSRLNEDDFNIIQSVDLGLDGKIDFASSQNAVEVNLSTSFYGITGNASHNFVFDNWKEINFTINDDKLVLSDSAFGNIFSGGDGNDTLDLSGLSNGVTVDVSDLEKPDLTITDNTDPSKVITYGDFEIFVATSNDDTFLGSASSSINFSGAGTNTIDYSSIGSSTTRGFIFELNGDDVIDSGGEVTTYSVEVTKSEISNYSDKLTQSYTTIMGTASNDTFRLVNNLSSGIYTIDGGDGVDTLELNVTTSNGVVFDLTTSKIYFKTNSTNVHADFTVHDQGADILSFSNIETLTGSAVGDIFLINNSIFNVDGGFLDGNGWTNTGHGPDGNQIYLDSKAGERYVLNTAQNTLGFEQINGQLNNVTYDNIHEMFFGDGDEEVIIAGSSSLTHVDGGNG